MNDDTRISLDRYASIHEAMVARRIVRVALSKGWTISVYDGGEWTVKKSADRMTILQALATTEADMLRFRNADNVTVGTLVLIWGNDPSGDELIADYSVDGGGVFTDFINEVSP